MDAWLHAVERTPLTGTSGVETFASLFSLNVVEPHVALLCAEVQKDGIAAASTQGRNFSYPSLAEAVKSYLNWCQNVNPNDPIGSFDWYAKFLQALATAFAHPKGSALHRAAIQAVFTLDRLYRAHSTHRAWLSNVELRMFNAVRSDRQQDQLKRPALLPLAVALCRSLFAIGNLSSCSQIFGQIDANDGLMRYKVEYRYWLGRWSLYKLDPVAAFHHLRWAYLECYPSSLKNRRIILEWLLVPSILAGRLPTNELLTSLGCQHGVAPIIAALRTGIRCYSPAFKDSWILSHHLVPVLESHLPLLVVRQALRRLLRILGSPGKLDLSAVQCAFGFSGVENLDSAFVMTESLCEALISAGYLKANVLPASQSLRLKPEGSIPTLLQVTRVLDD